MGLYKMTMPDLYTADCCVDSVLDTFESMSYHDQISAAAAPRTAAAVSSIKVMDSVDSTNSLLSRALMLGNHHDAYTLVRELFNQELFNQDSPMSEQSTVQSQELNTLPVSVATSDVQTQCRGRLGRKWSNKPGESFMASWVLPVPQRMLQAQHAGWLTMIAGLCVYEGLKSVLTACGATALREQSVLALKWPNDIFVNGRKLGGILSELVPVNEDSSAVIFGVGINMFMSQSDSPIDLATSLQLEYGPLPSYEEFRDRLAAAISVNLRERLTSFYADPDTYSEQALTEVRAHSWTIGRQVRANLASGESVVGRALRIEHDASLVIQCHDGVERTVTTGDVGVLPG
ncbi:biotin--[acetyl-CoA-carboxylase] ligase [Bifidobacterium sp.]|uniref:biotin--[acetyl-CoA-carboxylase] ligase n=1 Tax=Bifidobacterium sp. TaxID=41200 RepID=UPI0025C47101|nr:biotin--[acetyl-CoA-carboxylase] ligase [Bifidobacterium sp.]MCI1635147.1 biotin--[acetyl-CoA-carboxylase] ligase [Bifidobacterium sp.]